MVDNKLLFVINCLVNRLALINTDYLLKTILGNVSGTLKLQRGVVSDDFDEYRRLDQQHGHICKLQSEHVVQ